MKNIVLIGFMGTGKTTVGKILAEMLGRNFVDLDMRIEEKEGQSISDIFTQKGECYFRNCEKNIVRDISVKKDLVIATGGGTFKDKDNVAMLRNNGIIISLFAASEVIYERTKKYGYRPVLDAADKGSRLQAIEQLLQERAEIYAQADIRLNTSELSPLQLVKIIIHKLQVR